MRHAVRRASAGAALAVACSGACAHGGEAAAAARMPQRVALLQRAQAELEHGDATQALDDFERAAMMLHAADAELGLIRAAMQDGQYRRALAMGAHTAGEHTDDADGGALYAWLLRVGGQEALARQVLATTLANVRTATPADSPGDAVATAVETAFAATPPTASGILLQPLHRMAPWPVPSSPAVPAAARFASNAVLVDDGTAALLPLDALGPDTHARVWVRNGLGQAAQAQPDSGDAALAARGLARLRLRQSLPVGASRQPGGRAPFAGSPGYAIGFGSGSAPAWPMLTQGFLGTLVGDTALRKLGFASAPGAAVLDVHGTLVGITLAGAGASATWLPLPGASPSPANVAVPAVHAGLALTAPDEIYEAGLRRALQVLVEEPR